MKRPLDYQIAIADAVGTISDVAASFGIDPGSVLQVRKLVREFRRWEALVIAEETLPLDERRIEFIPLSRHTRTVLRRESFEKSADFFAIVPG